MTNVAVIGTGSAGMKHLVALKRLNLVQVTAVPVRRERMKELEDMGYHTAVDVNQAIQEGATLGIIATDTNRHFSDCCAALNGGMHILCEKPLAPAAQEAKEIHRRALAAQRNLFVGCVLRFSESLNIFKQQCSTVGRLHSVRIEFQSYLPDWRPTRPYQQTYSTRSNEGGVLLDLTHEIDYAGWLFGWPDSVFARINNLGRLNIDACEMAELSWQTSADCAVSVNLDYLSRPPHRTMKAYGEHGTVAWDWHAGKVELNLAGSETREWHSNQTVEDLFLAQAQAFVESSADGGNCRIATGEDGVNAIALCDAATLSSELKREEKVVYS